MTRSRLSGRTEFALALVAALAMSGAHRADAAGRTTTTTTTTLRTTTTTTTSTTTTTTPLSLTSSKCVIGYPFKSPDARTNVYFNESEVLRAFNPQGTVLATPGLTIKVWYNDEHAMTLGIRQVIVKQKVNGKTITTTTNYPFSKLTTTGANSVLYPQVGATALDGAQAGTDSSACSGFPDLCDRPMFPALFLTDITANANSRAADWQAGGAPIPPHAVFGTWKGAVRYVDMTQNPPAVTLAVDSDPSKNNWALGSGDPAPSGLKNEGYGAEVRWNVDDLVASGRMILGHTYRLQFMVHDGDQNKTGGDSGEMCVNVQVKCTSQAQCNDGDSCTTDTCDAGVCNHTTLAVCKRCKANTDCNDSNSCTADSCVAGACVNTAIPGCTLCSGPADCNAANGCMFEDCVAGVCQSTPIPDCTPCNLDTDCDDHNGCTYDTCDGGVCSNTTVEGCKTCNVASDCDDGNACTTESCLAGVCYNTAISKCKACTTASNCNDGNACTTDTCNGGVCSNVVVAGCVPCTTNAACNDFNSCTTDTCTGGVCVHTNTCGAADLTPTLVDPTPAGAGDAPAAAEICGNCIDDDGNGLTDFEDPACCADAGTLTLEDAFLRPAGDATRLALRTALEGVSVTPFDDDVTLQIRAADGTEAFCARIPAASFVKRHNVFRFIDPKHSVASAEGLDLMTIKAPAKGAVRLLTAAKRASMSTPAAGDVQVTVGFHAGDGTNRCATAVHTFSAGRNGSLRIR